MEQYWIIATLSRGKIIQRFIKRLNIGEGYYFYFSYDFKLVEFFIGCLCVWDIASPHSLETWRTNSLPLHKEYAITNVHHRFIDFFKAHRLIRFLAPSIISPNTGMFLPCNINFRTYSLYKWINFPCKFISWRFILESFGFWILPSTELKSVSVEVIRMRGESITFKIQSRS